MRPGASLADRVVERLQATHGLHEDAERFLVAMLTRPQHPNDLCAELAADAEQLGSRLRVLGLPSMKHLARWARFTLALEALRMDGAHGPRRRSVDAVLLSVGYLDRSLFYRTARDLTGMSVKRIRTGAPTLPFSLFWAACFAGRLHSWARFRPLLVTPLLQAQRRREHFAALQSLKSTQK